MGDGNPIYNDDMQTIVNFERMKLVADRVLELYHIDASQFSKEIVGNSTLKRHLAHINPPSSDELYNLSARIEPPRSKKTMEEEVVELRQANKQLKEQVSELKRGDR